jgi:tetratricopeptide (TPR) repeat protein
MNLPPEEWEEVKALFEAALDAAPEAQVAFLAKNCPDEDVRREVERLLQNHGEMGGFLTDPVLADRRGSPDIPARPTFSVGNVLASRFKITRFIASGGMGEVYAAEDLQLMGEVAIKTIRPEMLQEDGSVERFKREVQVAKQVTHPNVCRIYDLFVSSASERSGTGSSGEGLFFVSMELLCGETLAQRLKRSGRMAAGEGLPIAIQVASGVGAAHQAGVLHRDLKPGNILLVPSNRPEGVRAVVTDFGLARSSTADPKPAATSMSQPSASGTPAYMSPEQLQGKELTPASDVYALGLVMYEMATGSPAFPTAFRDLCQIPPSPRSLAPGLSRSWEAAISKCLEPEPSRRFQSAAEVSKALTRVPPRSFRAAVLVALSIVAVLAAVATLVWMGARLRARFRKGATETSVSPASRRSMAVLGFKNATGRADAAWISTALSEMLTTELAAGEQVRMIPEESVSRAKLELSMPDADRLDGDTLVRIRSRLGCDLVILGSYTTLGGQPRGPVRVDLRVQDAKTGQVLASVAETGSEQELFSLVSAAGSRLRQKLGLAEVSVAESGSVQASLPSTPEVARLYSEGLARLRLFDALGARNLLEQAVAAEPRFPLAHLALADAWSALGYDEKAKQEAKTAFDFAGSLFQEERLWVEAQYREMTRQWELASDIYSRLWKFYPDNIEYGLRLAEAQASAGKGKDAFTTVEGLRRLPGPGKDDPRIDLAEAQAARSLADFKREQAATARAAATAEAQGARLLVARTRLEEGGAFADVGEPGKALALDNEGKQIYAKAGDRGNTAKALLDIGYVLQDEGDLEGAKRSYDESLAISRQIGDRRSVAKVLNNVAAILYRQGDLSTTRKMLEESMTNFREIGDTSAVAMLLNNIATVVVDQGDFADAKRDYEESLRISRDLSDKLNLTRTLGNLAHLLATQGDLDGAKNRLQESLKVANEIGNKKQSAYALFWLGEVLLDRGDVGGARRMHEDALALRNEIGEKSMAAESRLGLAEVSFEEGRFPQAQAAAREAAEGFQTENDTDQEAVANALLARYLLAQGKSFEAQRAVERAVDLSAKSEDRGVRLDVAIATGRVRAAIGKPDEALRMLQNTLIQSKRLGYVGYQFEARLALGEVEMHSGHAAEGRACLAALQKDAEAKGFGLVARKAAADLAAAAH